MSTPLISETTDSGYMDKIIISDITKECNMYLSILIHFTTEQHELECRLDFKDQLS